MIILYHSTESRRGANGPIGDEGSMGSWQAKALEPTAYLTYMKNVNTNVLAGKIARKIQSFNKIWIRQSNLSPMLKFPECHLLAIEFLWVSMK